MSMEAKESTRTILPPRELLHQTVIIANTLYQSATSLLRENGDIPASLFLLRHRAERIAHLPEKLKESLSMFGGRIPGHYMKDLEVYAEQAREALKEGKETMLGTILDTSSSGPTFEDLVNQIYPPKRPKRSQSTSLKARP